MSTKINPFFNILKLYRVERSGMSKTRLNIRQQTNCTNNEVNVCNIGCQLSLTKSNLFIICHQL